MSDNLKILKENLDVAIDPNAGIGDIKAQDHNDVFTELIIKQGKYNGIPLNASSEVGLAGYRPGRLIWNNNAFDNTSDFTITISQTSKDLNNITPIFSNLSSGDVIKFKDFLGRSCLLEYKSHTLDNTLNIINVVVSGYSTNSNYSYQAGEVEQCVIGFFQKSSQTQVQSDWAEEDTNSLAYIKNKPDTIRKIGEDVVTANAHGCFLRNDGLMFYSCRAGTSFVEQYSLTKPFDLSTKTLVQSINVGSPNLVSMFISRDGLKMILASNSSGVIYEHNLSVAWDVSTTSTSVNTLNTGAYLLGIDINDFGNKLFINDGNNIVEYVLGVNYDLSTVVSNNVVLTQSIGTIDDFSFGNGGYDFYIAGRGNDLQFWSLLESYNLSTATLVQTVEVGEKSLGLCASKNRGYLLSVRGTIVTMYQNDYSQVIKEPIDFVDLATKGLSIRDINDIEQFVSDEFIQLKGGTFDPANKLWSVDPLGVNTYYLKLTGNDATGEFENSNRPYKTIDAILDLFQGQTQSNNVAITIHILDSGTYHLTKQIQQVFNLRFFSEFGCTIDFSNFDFTNAPVQNNNIIFINNQSVTPYLTFDIPNGKIRNTTTTPLRWGGEDYVTTLNVGSIENLSESQMFYCRNLRLRAQLDYEGVAPLYFAFGGGTVDNLIFGTYQLNGIAVANGNMFPNCKKVTINNLVLNNVDNSTRLFQGLPHLVVGNVSGTNSNFRFWYHTGKCKVEFNNSVISIPMLFTQSLGNVTFTGIIESILSIGGTIYVGTASTEDNLIFDNLIIRSVGSGQFSMTGDARIQIRNSVIESPGNVISVNKGSNCKILGLVNLQTTPGLLVSVTDGNPITAYGIDGNYSSIQ